MGHSCLEIQNKVLEILENDAVLSSYVKQFSIGNDRAARKLFPFITVSEVTRNIAPLCIGNVAPDMQTFKIAILAGSHHTLPETACEGNNSGAKGIVQLVDDITVALYPGNLDGMLDDSIHLVRVSSDSGRSSVKTGKVIFEGFKKS